jgi:hypothetical protein
MSTNFRFTEQVSEAAVREAVANSDSLSIELHRNDQGKEYEVLTDGTNFVCIYFNDGMSNDFCRYGANSGDPVYELGAELGVDVLNEHDEGYFD